MTPLIQELKEKCEKAKPLKAVMCAVFGKSTDPLEPREWIALQLKDYVDPNDFAFIAAATPKTVLKLIAALEIAEKSLRAIEGNPTCDGAYIINHENTWTKWAKKNSSEALEQIKKELSE